MSKKLAEEIAAAAVAEFSAAHCYDRGALRLLPPPVWQIQDITQRPATVVIVGAHSTGKTFTALGMACSEATGTAWVGGRKVHSPTNVLYVVGEGAAGLNRRISAWEDFHGTKVPDEALTVKVRPGSLLREEVWEQVSAWCLEHDVGSVYLDTFSSLAPDADEVRDSALIMSRMADLADLIEGTVHLVHHTGWGNQDRARGGSQFEANADIVLLLQGEPGIDAFTMTVKKAKDEAAGLVVYLSRTPHLGSCVVEEASPAAMKAPFRTKVMTLLTGMSPDGMTAPQIVAALAAEANRSEVYKVLREMLTDEVAVCDKPWSIGDSLPKMAVYSIPSST